MGELTPKELLELADIEMSPTIAAALRSYAELLSMMEFIDDSVECTPRLLPQLIREMARELGWENIDTGWDNGSP